MAARISSTLRISTLSRPALAPSLVVRSQVSKHAQRPFQTSRPLMQEGPTAQRKPVGAFRGTVFGFLLGSVLAGGGLYYYVIDEYKVSNELLTEDIYALQAAVQRIETYVKDLENEVKTKK